MLIFLTHKTGLRMVALALLSLLPFSGRTEAPQRLTATALEQQVLSGNASLEAMEQQLIAAQQARSSAGALDDPMLTYGLAPRSVGRDDIDTGHIYGFSQALPWPGKLAARETLAEQKAQSVAQSRDQMVRSLLREAQKLYAEWFYVHRALAENLEEQALFQALIKTSESLYVAGNGSQQALLAARVRLTRAHRVKLQLDAMKVGLAARINALRQRSSDSPVLPPENLPNPGPLPSPQQLMTALRESHPALLQQQANEAAAETKIELARLAFRPDFKLNINHLGTLPRAEYRSQIGFSVNLPFGQSKRDSALSAAQAELAAAKATRRDLESTLRAQLDQAMATEQAGAASISLIAESLLPLAESSLQAARDQYAAGSLDIRSVIDAEAELLAARLGLARAQADQFISRADLRWLAASAFTTPLPEQRLP